MKAMVLFLTAVSFLLGGCGQAEAPAYEWPYKGGEVEAPVFLHFEGYGLQDAGELVLSNLEDRQVVVPNGGALFPRLVALSDSKEYVAIGIHRVGFTTIEIWEMGSEKSKRIVSRQLSSLARALLWENENLTVVSERDSYSERPEVLVWNKGAHSFADATPLETGVDFLEKSLDDVDTILSLIPLSKLNVVDSVIAASGRSFTSHDRLALLDALPTIALSDWDAYVAEPALDIFHDNGKAIVAIGEEHGLACYATSKVVAQLLLRIAAPPGKRIEMCRFNAYGSQLYALVTELDPSKAKFESASQLPMGWIPTQLPSLWKYDFQNKKWSSLRVQFGKFELLGSGDLTFERT